VSIPDPPSLLQVTLYQGRTADGPVAGRGSLYVHALDLANSLTTLEVLGTDDLSEKAKALARCGEFFLGTLAKLAVE